MLKLPNHKITYNQMERICDKAREERTLVLRNIFKKISRINLFRIVGLYRHTGMN